MRCNELFSAIDASNSQYLSIWETVCNLESPTADTARVNAVGDYFIKLATEKGWAVDVLPLTTAGSPICITLNPEAQAQPVVFSGHIDTVHPVGLFGTPAVRQDTEKIYGPGVEDCKGGVVASFMAMDALDRCGFRSRPVKLIIQTDEETGSRNSGKKTVDYMCRIAKDAIAFLNTEGYQSHIAVLQRKGILRYQFHIRGVAAHSAACNHGASAITEAAYKILKLEKWKDPKGLTCNCGVIQGGTVANTVAEHCSFLADIRFSTAAQYHEAVKFVEDLAAITHVPGCSCTLERISHRPAMELTARNQQLLETMNAIFLENDLPQLQPSACISGSDAAYVTEAEIPCVDNMGVEGGNIHSVREYAWLDSLAASAKRLAAVAYCI